MYNFSMLFVFFHCQELHAGYIESQLLNQVRVVFPGQLLPIWIQSNMCVVVQIGEFV